MRSAAALLHDFGSDMGAHLAWLLGGKGLGGPE